MEHCCWSVSEPIRTQPAPPSAGPRPDRDRNAPLCGYRGASPRLNEGVRTRLSPIKQPKLITLFSRLSIIFRSLCALLCLSQVYVLVQAAYVNYIAHPSIFLD